MIMMVRDRDYPALIKDLRGKRVAIWTCNTCARLSKGLGGLESAERLAESLRKDGIDVVGTGAVSASCVEKKLIEKAEEGFAEKADIILSLTCNVGSFLASKVFDIPVINPVIILGSGYIGAGNELFLVDGNDKVSEVESVISKKGYSDGPFM
jgi:hypothetical protein